MPALPEFVYLEDIQLAPQPIGQGAEGSVFELTAPAHLRGYVAKIYHQAQRKPERAKKISFMMAHPPALSDALAVIWPEKLLTKDGKFVGFLMKKARGLFDLTVLSSLHTAQKIGKDWEKTFNRSSQEGLAMRAKICFNLANAIKELHESRQYVITDIKPENIKVNIQGLVSLIDMDSIEIIDTETETVRFSAEKCSPEYAPPELKNLDFKEDIIPETWDRFSLAVVCYKVLLGLHPFSGTGQGDYEKLVTLQAKIQAGLFPNGERRVDFRVIPKPHENFEALPLNIQNLFRMAFEKGIFKASARPRAAEWAKQLQDFRLVKPFYQSLLPAKQAVQTAALAQENAFDIPEVWGVYRWSSDAFYWLVFYTYLTNSTILGYSHMAYWVMLVPVFSLVLANKPVELGFDIENQKLRYRLRYLLGMYQRQSISFEKLLCEQEENTKRYKIKFYKKTFYKGKKLLFSVKFSKTDTQQKADYHSLIYFLRKWSLISREVLI